MNSVTTKLRTFGVFFLLLGIGCTVGLTPDENIPAPEAVMTQSAAPAEPILTAAVSATQQVLQAAETQAPIPPSATVASDLPGATSGPDCLGAETNPIASAIAADYPFTSYAEVMTWFCNGAEFEDILSALMTEELTGTPAEESLQMLADGFTWDEIWQLIGLTE